MRARDPVRFVVVIFTGVAGVLIAWGATRVLEQQRQIEAARPVTARVTGAMVHSYTTRSKNGQTQHYSPKVRYAYAVGEAVYSTDRVFPGSQDTSLDRARRIVADYPPAKTVTAWYDPAQPGKAFLLREWDFTPYFFVLGPMLHLSIGLGLWAALPLLRRKVAPPVLAKTGWFELPIRAAITARRKPWLLITVMWYLVGGLALGHYFGFAERPYGLAALIAAPVYLALGLIPLAGLIYYRRMRKNQADARAFADTDRFVLGKTFKVRTEQMFHKHLAIDSVRVGLVCEITRVTQSGGKKTIATTPHWQTWVDGPPNEQTSPGRTIEVKANLKAQADQPPSTPADAREYPRYAWRVVLEVTIAGAPHYEAQYPITVTAGS